VRPALLPLRRGLRLGAHDHRQERQQKKRRVPSHDGPILAPTTIDVLTVPLKKPDQWSRAGGPAGGLIRLCKIPHAMMTGRGWLAGLVAGVVIASCSGDGPGTPPTSIEPPARVLVVTHTEGFRHSSIPIAEATITDLGRRANLFSTTFCRTAADVATMLTPSGLAGIDAIVFANTTGSLPIRDLPAVLNWIADGHG